MLSRLLPCRPGSPHPGLAPLRRCQAELRRLPRPRVKKSDSGTWESAMGITALGHGDSSASPKSGSSAKPLDHASLSVLSLLEFKDKLSPIAASTSAADLAPSCMALQQVWGTCPQDLHEATVLGDILVAVYGMVTLHLSTIRPKDKASIIATLSKFPNCDNQVLQMLTEATKGQLEQVPSRELAKMFEAVSLQGVRPSLGWLGEFMSAVQEQLTQLHVREQVAVLCGLVRLGVKPTPLWLSSFTEASASNLQDLPCADLSSLARACGEIGFQPPEKPWMDSFLLASQYSDTWASQERASQPGESLESCTSEAAITCTASCTTETVQPHVQPHELADILWGVSKMSSNPLPPDWQESFLLTSQQTMPRFKPADLVRLAGAVACLRMRPSAVWMESLVTHSLKALQQCSARDLADLVEAMAVLLPAWTGVIQSESRLTGESKDRWVHSFLAESRTKMSRFTVQALPQILAALVRLRVQPGPAWLHELSDMACSKLSVMSPSDLCTLTTALADVGHVPGPAALDALAAQSLSPHHGNKVAALGNGEAVCMLVALGRLGAEPDATSRTTLLQGLERRLPKLSASQLADLLVALVKLRVKPTPAWMRGFYASVDAQLGYYTAEALTELLWALHVGHFQSPAPWMNRVLEYSATVLRRSEMPRDQHLV